MTRLPADSTSGPVAPEVLDEQLAYYRARAPEYDRWFRREGRYDRGPEVTIAWQRELDEVRGQLAQLDLDGRDVLELAAGTGLWTEALLNCGAAVTAVDAAPEMLAQLERRIPAGRLSTIRADLFTWVPARQFDAVVSCFFMSHVPDELFDGFVALVVAAVRPGGRVFLLDSRPETLSTAADHTLPTGGAQTMLRRLDDGRTFTIVKRFRTDTELTEAFAAHAIAVSVRDTATFFQTVVGTRG